MKYTVKRIDENLDVGCEERATVGYQPDVWKGVEVNGTLLLCSSRSDRVECGK